MANEVLKAVLSELHAAGVRDVTVAAGGKYRQVRFANSPSDICAVPNTRSDLASQKAIRGPTMSDPISRLEVCRREIDRAP